MFSVVVKNRGEPLQVEMGRTILETALAAGVDYPHGCRTGNCGACKSVLHSGNVEMSPFSEFALSSEEQDRGLILACRSVPWSDCVVSPVDSDEAVTHASRHLTCTVVDITQATHDIRIIRLEICSGGPYDFSPGQYAQLIFDGLPSRDFSMASQPGQDIVEFHIRLVPGGAVSPYITEILRVGHKVVLNGPHGTAYFRPSHTGPIIAAAGGSGLAPIKSIIDSALAKGARQDIHLYFGVRDERDLYMEDYFEMISSEYTNFTFVPVLSEPSGITKRRTGYIAEALEQDFVDLDGFKIYLAGPPMMVETAVASVISMGIHQHNIHADAFYTEAEKAALG